MDKIGDMDKIACVIESAGGVSALAAELGVKAPTVYQWKSGDRKVSPRLAIAISQRWPDVATVHDLRPDIFGPSPAPAKLLLQVESDAQALAVAMKAGGHKLAYWIAECLRQLREGEGERS